MKKNLLLLPIVLLLSYVIFSSNKDAPAGLHSIDGTGATNTLGCGGTGGSCHASSTSIVGGIFLVDAAGDTVDTYTPGATYNVFIAGANTNPFATLPVFGVQVTSVKQAGVGTSGAVMAGTFATTGLPALTTNSSYGSLHYCEQTDTIHTDTTITFGTFSLTGYKEYFSWTAPAAGTGTIVLCGVICAANGDGAITGDAYNKFSHIITEAIVTAPITGTTTTCVGSTTTLSDTSRGGTWSSATPSVATVSSSGIVTGVSAGTAVISYTTSLGSATTTVTVTNISAGTISGASSVCVGGAGTTLSETVTGGTWTISPATVATISGSGTVTGITAGTANVTYTVTGSCGSVSTNYSLTVASGVAAGVITGSLAVCEGLTSSLSESVSGGSWASGTPTVATVSGTGVVTGLAVGTANITYTVTNACGTARTNATVTVAASPSSGSISGPSTVCYGNTVIFSESAAGGAWSSSDSAIVSVDGVGNVTGAAAGTAAISYSVTNSTGCAAYAIDSVTVLVGPAASITAAGPTSFCYGDVVLDANTGRGLTYQWYVGTTAIPGATGATYTANATGAYIVHVADATGCATPSTATGVTVLSVPAIMISGDTTFCSGHDVVLSVSAVGGGFTSVYQWKKNTINIAGATNTSYSATTAGTYTCFENISGGCTGTTPSVEVTVNASPNPVITYNGVALSVPSTYTTYQWQMDGVAIPGATTSTYTPTTDATYTVLVSVATTGCTGLSHGFVFGPSMGVATVANGEWNVFPNPATNLLNINNASGNAGNASYTITDVPGRTILSGNFSGSTQQVDISRLIPGNYILKIETDNGSQNRMFVKQ